MADHAQALITVIDEHGKTTTEQAKVVAEEREQQTQSQENILKAISNIVG